MDLQNRAEHTGCLFYANAETALFHRYRLREAELLQPAGQGEGIILYVQEGSLIVQAGKAAPFKMERHQMTFLSRDDGFSVEACTPASVMTCLLSLHLPLCSRYSFGNLLKDYEAEASKGVASSVCRNVQEPLDANVRIVSFFTNLDEVLGDGLNGIPFHELKRQEFLILLRVYYSKEELFGLFKAIIKHDNVFKRFILQNYTKVSDVNEFASLANMSVRSFQRKFKAEFKCSLRDWFLARRTEQVLHELRNTDRSLFDIAMDFGFSGMSYFTTFCKNNLGMTPSELRGQRRGTREDESNAEKSGVVASAPKVRIQEQVSLP